MTVFRLLIGFVYQDSTLLSKSFKHGRWHHLLRDRKMVIRSGPCNPRWPTILSGSVCFSSVSPSPCSNRWASRSAARSRRSRGRSAPPPRPRAAESIRSATMGSPPCLRPHCRAYPHPSGAIQPPRRAPAHQRYRTWTAANGQSQANCPKG